MGKSPNDSYSRLEEEIVNLPDQEVERFQHSFGRVEAGLLLQYRCIMFSKSVRVYL